VSLYVQFLINLTKPSSLPIVSVSYDKLKTGLSTKAVDNSQARIKQRRCWSLAYREFTKNVRIE